MLVSIIKGLWITYSINTDLQGAGNNYLFYYKERSETGVTTPRYTYNSRKATADGVVLTVEVKIAVVDRPSAMSACSPKSVVEAARLACPPFLHLRWYLLKNA